MAYGRESRRCNTRLDASQEVTQVTIGIANAPLTVFNDVTAENTRERENEQSSDVVTEHCNLLDKVFCLVAELHNVFGGRSDSSSAQ